MWKGDGNWNNRWESEQSSQKRHSTKEWYVMWDWTCEIENEAVRVDHRNVWTNGAKGMARLGLNTMWTVRKFLCREVSKTKGTVRLRDDKNCQNYWEIVYLRDHGFLWKRMDRNEIKAMYYVRRRAEWRWSRRKWVNRLGDALLVFSAYSTTAHERESDAMRKP